MKMIATLYGYGMWANHRLLAKAAALSDAQLGQKLTNGADPILMTFGLTLLESIVWTRDKRALQIPG